LEFPLQGNQLKLRLSNCTSMLLDFNYTCLLYWCSNTSCINYLFEIF